MPVDTEDDDKDYLVVKSWNVTSLTPHTTDAMSIEGTHIQFIQEANLSGTGIKNVATAAAINGWSMISGQPVFKRGYKKSCLSRISTYCFLGREAKQVPSRAPSS